MDDKNKIRLDFLETPSGIPLENLPRISPGIPSGVPFTTAVGIAPEIISRISEEIAALENPERILLVILFGVPLGIELLQRLFSEFMLFLY